MALSSVAVEGRRYPERLERMAGLLADAFSVLPGELSLAEPARVETVDAAGGIRAIEHGKHLHLTVRPDAPKGGRFVQAVLGTFDRFAQSRALSGVILAGVIPVLRTSRGRLYDELAVGSRAPPGRHEGWVRRTITIAQFAGSMMLLVGAGVLVRGSAPRPGDAPVRRGGGGSAPRASEAPPSDPSAAETTPPPSARHRAGPEATTTGPGRT